MIIRPATVEDIPAMAAVAAAAWRTAFVEILEPEALSARDEASFSSRFEQERERMSVAVEAGVVIGFALVTDHHVDMLFVHPEQAGKGVGRVLLRHAEKTGARSLECFRDNAAARRFYEREGWTVVASYERAFLGRMRDFVRFEKGVSPA